MKTKLLIVLQLFCALGLFAQGSIRFENRVTGTSTAAVVAPIYGVDPACPAQVKYGNPATAGTAPIPVGTQVYGGAPLTGSGYTASIWARVAGQTAAAFVQAATTPFRTTTSTALFGFWTTPGTAVVLQNVPSDPTVRAEIIIRVWDNGGGTISSWAQAIDPASVAHGWGESLPFVVPDQLGGGVVLPPTLVGLQSFQFHLAGGNACPEPSVIALGGLGLVCLVLFRRRK